jgi:ATP-dependent helicase/nuclease subunit A
LYKEAEFNFLKESDGVEVMVQGVIDCFFKDGDNYVLIDYKNSYIDPERREEGLKRIKESYTTQVELYREALQQIKGGEVSGSYLYLFSEGQFIEI